MHLIFVPHLGLSVVKLNTATVFSAGHLGVEPHFSPTKELRFLYGQHCDNNVFFKNNGHVVPHTKRPGLISNSVLFFPSPITRGMDLTRTF